ncbi:LynF/TruF/PatF family peptide O-prenyltransferase [Nostoc punctiforme FACHB-252]|uniref:LynF/TruF/PatF family peptide O-prenyltransferase n=1 Tax=Nostoc punctiforme FACHB-252 TaxID=1357509 RepID=A0ABR8HDB0_NOSPU|nr:LynF/TruF/PatF family peptide O-prenyltransferase [Nostoc punctiforme]MBD2613212.1 LynF/TruF/PatF family peptide O-prenyltransferase [Nostoc punctiforme FACHB-252]
MVTSNPIKANSERYLEYIGKHKLAFDIYEDLYPLKLFEDFVEVEAKKRGLFYILSNVDKDEIYPARFCLRFPSLEEAQLLYNPQQQLQTALNFFRQVESRPEVKLNYHHIQQFFGSISDFQGIILMAVAIDARTVITESRLKLYVWLKNAPEKVETAIALCGDSPTLRAFLVNDKLQVGFDLFFNGESEIEVYPIISQDELQQFHIRDRIIPLLPPRALPLLQQCAVFQVGFSEANESNILYFDYVHDPNSFVDNLGNEMTKKVHAYYRHQPIKSLTVGIPEHNFYGRAIEHVKLYYDMN